jgi:hypothetical protein
VAAFFRRLTVGCAVVGCAAAVVVVVVDGVAVTAVVEVVVVDDDDDAAAAAVATVDAGAAEILGFAPGLSFGLGPELPHDALPCAEVEPFFPLAPEDGPLSVAAESRDAASVKLALVGAAVISKSISVSSA